MMADVLVSPSSPAASVAANARQAIERDTAELAALHASAETMKAERAELLSERVQAEQRRADLAAIVSSARADLDTARLASEMASGVAGAEAAAQEAVEHASALWDDAHSDLLAHETRWGERDAVIAERLDFLQRSLDESASMTASLQARLAQLRGVFDASHSQHGKDAQQALESEFAALAEQRQAVLAQLAEVDQQEANLRSQIAGRLADWPPLARECLSQHLADTPGAWRRMLMLWRDLAILAGDHSETIDQQTWQAFIGESSLPLWHLIQFGPRRRWEQTPEPGRDMPIRQYSRMLDNLAAHLERLEQAERAAQVNALLQG